MFDLLCFPFVLPAMLLGAVVGIMTFQFILDSQPRWTKYTRSDALKLLSRVVRIVAALIRLVPPLMDTTAAWLDRTAVKMSVPQDRDLPVSIDVVEDD